MDRTVAVGLSRVLAGTDGRGSDSGTGDVLRETARRFHDAHTRLDVDRVLLSVDGELRDRIATSGLLAELVRLLGATVLDVDVEGEAAALSRAARARGALDDGSVLLLELGDRVARVAHVEDGEVRSAARLPLRSLGELAGVARPRAGDGWLDIAVAAVAPLLGSVPLVVAPGSVRVVVAGAPAQLLARAVVSREWRRPIRAVDRVRVTAPTVLALTSELGAAPTGEPTPGLDVPEVDEATGAAVILSGLLATTGADHVLTTDAERLDGHLDEQLGAPARGDLATRFVEAVGPPTPHARQVARLAVSLFDGLAPIVGLGGGHRQVLEAAALVHDIARAEGPGHHRRGAERVLGLQLRGVDPTTLVEVACVVRSQRGRPPGSHVPVFLRLPGHRRDAVERLVALLRLAEGLDRGDDGAVEGVRVTVDERPGGIARAGGGEAPLVCVDVTGDRVDLALYGARGQARHVERALGIRLVVRPVPRPVAAT